MSNTRNAVAKLSKSNSPKGLDRRVLGGSQPDEQGPTLPPLGAGNGFYFSPASTISGNLSHASYSVFPSV